VCACVRVRESGVSGVLRCAAMCELNFENFYFVFKGCSLKCVLCATACVVC